MIDSAKWQTLFCFERHMADFAVMNDVDPIVKEYFRKTVADLKSEIEAVERN